MKTVGEISRGEDRIEVYATLAEAREKFGENYAGFVFKLTRAQAEALLQGKVVAFDIGSHEYSGFLMVADSTAASTSSAAGEPRPEPDFGELSRAVEGRAVEGRMI